MNLLRAHQPGRWNVAVRFQPTGRLLAIALPLYFVWEMAQAPAFTGMPQGWWAATAVCALAALGDGVIIVALWALGTVLWRDVQWFVPPRWTRYAVVVLVGIALQATIEWIMVYRLGRWGYSPAHPLVPVVKIGALPVLQAVTLSPLAFWLTARWERATARRSTM
ncbi:MAG TPA: hypothetical protein VGT40_15660 [Methylomirabilota bacterium]|jgi:hypothetical protein|nr:hypothetical protein [Methylomirabilota bacterium]